VTTKCVYGHQSSWITTAQSIRLSTSTILSFVNILLRIGYNALPVLCRNDDKDNSQTARITLEDLQYPYDEVMAAIEF
jgi:hypothetical protein